MLLKEKYGLSLFLAVKYVYPHSRKSREMLHYLLKNKLEVLDLVNCYELWN